MGIHIQPQPLTSPLAGGRAGATVVVEPIVTGSISLVPELIESSGSGLEPLTIAWRTLSGKGKELPVPCFLIRHPEVGPILVDTGLHPSVASDPKHNFGPILSRFLRPSLEPGQDVISRLRSRGVEPEDVALVIITHLHTEHVSAISELPDSTFVVSAPEWEAATGPRPTRKGYRRAQFDFAFDYRTVDYDSPYVGSYASFGRTFDLFGDSSVRLAYTPGHTPGHQSVICRLREHDFVIGGDATYTERQILDDSADLPAAMVVADAHNYRRSLREIGLFHSHYADAIITPGHDPDFYSRLRKRYE